MFSDHDTLRLIGQLYETTVYNVLSINTLIKFNVTVTFSFHILIFFNLHQQHSHLIFIRIFHFPIKQHSNSNALQIWLSSIAQTNCNAMHSPTASYCCIYNSSTDTNLVHVQLNSVLWKSAITLHNVKAFYFLCNWHFWHSSRWNRGCN